MIRPWKLVAPVSDKFQDTHQAKANTHSPSDSESKHSKGPRKAKKQKKKKSKLRPSQPTIMVAERHRSEHEMRNFFIFWNQQRRTTSDQLYESVKPESFTTVPTSHTSCRRSQVKSRNKGKTHIFQH